jgi:hypothetical protein
MKLARTFCLAISLAGIGSLHAQGCSGGVDGGMDATGNQCNTARDVAAQAVEPATPRSSPSIAQAATQRPAMQDRPAKVALHAHRAAAKSKAAAPS